MDSNKNRIIWLDTLKGFATICVVLGHVVDGYMGAGFFPAHTQILRSLYNGTYTFHMALFFAISGMAYRLAYFWSDPHGSVVLKRDKLRKQMLNLLLIYILYCLVMGAFKIIVATYVNKAVSPIDLLLIWGKPIYPYWYLYVLIIYYFCFSFMLRRDWIQKRRIFFVVVLAAISCLSGFCNMHGWFQIQNVMKYALFFYIGIRTAEDKSLNWGISLLLTACALAVVILYWNDQKYICNVPVISTVAPLGIVLFLIKLGSNSSICNRQGILSFLGKHSLEIYVLHCFFTAGNRLFLPKLGIADFWTSMAVNLVSSIAIPVIVSMVSKKMGIYNLFFAPIRLIHRNNKNQPDNTSTQA